MECGLRIRGPPRPRIFISHSVSTDIIHEVDDSSGSQANSVCSTPVRRRGHSNGLVKRSTMSAFTPSGNGQNQGHTHNGVPHNIYTRASDATDIEMGCSSPSRSHRFIDSFRDRMNFRHRRDSANTSSFEADMLEEDLGFPPAYDTTPSTVQYGQSVPADVSFFQSDFRNRSRSDATQLTKPKMGTLIVFPHTPPNANASESNFSRMQRDGPPRSRRQRYTSLGANGLNDYLTADHGSPTHEELFVDTGIGNEIDPKQVTSPRIVTAAARDAPRIFSDCSSTPPQMMSRSCFTPNSSGCCQMGAGSPVRLCRSAVTSSSGRFNRSSMCKSHIQRSFDSGLDSPFSNCAILIKERHTATPRLPIVVGCLFSAAIPSQHHAVVYMIVPLG